VTWTWLEFFYTDNLDHRSFLHHRLWKSEILSIQTTWSGRRVLPCSHAASVVLFCQPMSLISPYSGNEVCDTQSEGYRSLESVILMQNYVMANTNQLDALSSHENLSLLLSSTIQVIRPSLAITLSSLWPGQFFLLRSPRSYNEELCRLAGYLLIKQSVWFSMEHRKLFNTDPPPLTVTCLCVAKI